MVLGVPLPDPRLSPRSFQARDDEAFFPDEWDPGGAMLASGLHQNKFATVGKNAIEGFVNPLLYLSSTWVDELTDKERKSVDDAAAKLGMGTGVVHTYRIFRPPNFSATETKVSLLFGLGQEMMMKGLRTFFERFTDRVLIVISGLQRQSPIVAQSIGRPWGVGIDHYVIDQLLKDVGAGPKYKIDVVAGFSAGYMGFNGTLNNFAFNAAQMDLTDVETVILYDSLYKAEKPAPGDNTKNALSRIARVAKNPPRLILYEVTAGTERVGTDTTVPQQWLSTTFPGRYGLIDLKAPASTKALSALLCARLFDAAVADGYIEDRTLAAPLRTLIGSLRSIPRGTVISPLPSLFSTPSGTPLTTWASSNQKSVEAVYGLRDTLVKTIKRPDLNLMGFSPFDFNTVLHDNFLSEFAWEFLAG